MANQYGNLGNVYRLQGNPSEAKRCYQKSIALFTQLGSPNAALVQSLLDKLQ